MKQNPTSPIQIKTTTPRLLIAIALALVYFALSPTPNAFGVSPPPDGGYFNGNTAEGENALFSLTGGFYNTAIGYQALYENIGGSRNTAIGLNALYHNTGDENTANGFQALFTNTSGEANTANGFEALFNNTTGEANSGTGYHALYQNTTGSRNTLPVNLHFMATELDPTTRPTVRVRSVATQSAPSTSHWATTPVYFSPRAITISISATMVLLMRPTLFGSARQEFKRTHISPALVESVSPVHL
jgi:hypothetical protein